MRGRPSCLLQSAGGEANRILLASALSSMHTICPNRVSRRDWIITESLGCFVSLRTSSFRTDCTIWCQAACGDTTGRVHQSYMHPSLILPSSPNHTGILARCTCCTASTSTSFTSTWPKYKCCWHTLMPASLKWNILTLHKCRHTVHIMTLKATIVSCMPQTTTTIDLWLRWCSVASTISVWFMQRSIQLISDNNKQVLRQLPNLLQSPILALTPMVKCMTFSIFCWTARQAYSHSSAEEHCAWHSLSSAGQPDRLTVTPVPRNIESGLNDIKRYFLIISSQWQQRK